MCANECKVSVPCSQQRLCGWLTGWLCAVREARSTSEEKDEWSVAHGLMTERTRRVSTRTKATSRKSKLPSEVYGDGDEGRRRAVESKLLACGMGR